MDKAERVIDRLSDLDFLLSMGDPFGKHPQLAQ
jgi:hypothetical protein